MLEVTVFVEPEHDAELLGIKESIAYALEQFGVVKRVTVREGKQEQLTMQEIEVASCAGIRILRDGAHLSVDDGKTGKKKYYYAQMAVNDFCTEISTKLHSRFSSLGEPYPDMEEIKAVPPGFQEYTLYNMES